MAINQNLITISLIAGEDLSSDQYTVLFLDTADNTVKKATAATSIAIGVLQNAPASGEAAEVAIGGVSKVLAGGTLTLGQLVASDRTAATIETTIAAGTATYGHAIGRALEAAASGEYFELLITPMFYIDSIA